MSCVCCFHFLVDPGRRKKEQKPWRGDREGVSKLQPWGREEGKGGRDPPATRFPPIGQALRDGPNPVSSQVGAEAAGTGGGPQVALHLDVIRLPSRGSLQTLSPGSQWQEISRLVSRRGPPENGRAGGA